MKKSTYSKATRKKQGFNVNKHVTVRVVRDEKRAFTERGAAKYIGRSVYFMRDCRIGRAGVAGPEFIKVGRSVVYLREDLDAWLDSFKDGN